MKLGTLAEAVSAANPIVDELAKFAGSLSSFIAEKDLSGVMSRKRALSQLYETARSFEFDTLRGASSIPGGWGRYMFMSRTLIPSIRQDLGTILAIASSMDGWDEQVEVGNSALARLVTSSEKLTQELTGEAPMEASP